MVAGVRVKPGKKARPVIPRIGMVLGYGGVIPFAATAMLVATTWPSETGHDVLQAQILYAAIVLSFLGGVRWGAVMAEFGDMATRPPHAMGPAMIRAVLPPVAGWLCVLVPPAGALAALSLIYLGQYLGDVSAAKSGTLTQWYGALRGPLTLLAVGSLLVSLITILGFDVFEFVVAFLENQ